MWKVIVIPADNAQPLREETITEGNLQLLQALVGGYIEHVIIGDCTTLQRFGTRGTTVAMYVDEDGIAQGKSQNDRAAVLYGVLIHHQGIYGDAIITGEYFDPMDGGDICSVPDEYGLDFWKGHFKKVAEHFPEEFVPQ